MIIIIESIGLLIIVLDFWNGSIRFSDKLERNAAGSGDYTENLEIDSKYFQGDYTVEVKEQVLTKKQVKKLFDAAKKEIDTAFPGENKDSNAILTDVNVTSTYQNGLVRAKWMFDNYQVINSVGEIQVNEVEEPTIVQATVELKYQQYQENYTFSFRVVPADDNTEAGFLRALQKELQKENREKKKLSLPASINGEKIRWKRKNTYRGVKICLLGILLYFLIPFANRLEEKKKKQKEEKERVWDYPSIVGQMELLLGVGISLPEAIERVVLRYENKKQETGKRRAGFEMVSYLYRQMSDGVSEYQALGNFGKQSERMEYRRLALLLQQNQKKGNDRLGVLLEKENMEAFEMRKNLAKKAGDEASTKLLIPMLGMLGIVFIILIIPALWMLKGV